jgi:hypothetical protein
LSGIVWKKYAVKLAPRSITHIAREHGFLLREVVVRASNEALLQNMRPANMPPSTFAKFAYLAEASLARREEPGHLEHQAPG